MSGMDAASSVKVLPSVRECGLDVSFPLARKENLCLVGEAGLSGEEGGRSRSLIDRAANSVANAIALSSVFSSAAEIGFTCTHTC